MPTPTLLEETFPDESDLAARLRRAEADNRAKDDFLAVLSHELRTPTSAILLWARLLMSGAVKPADQAEALRCIVRSAEVQNRLVEDLVDVARLSRGAVELERLAVELGEVVGCTVAGLRTVAAARGVTLAIVNEGQTSATVSADPRRLQQIVANLVSNAIKFTPSGGCVEVTVSATRDLARLAVRDTGCGIARERLVHVFDPFYLAEARTTRRHEGMGLGLSIVSQLVSLHGGSLGAESAGEGKGATFTVELPLSSDGLHAERHLRDVISRPLAGVRVLLVEDHVETRRALDVALAFSGAEVVAVGSAGHAFAVATESPPDVIVSDICMPAEDGFTLLRRLRADARANHRPAPLALALTAHGGQVRAEALAAGFRAHASKPIDPEELVRLVATLYNTQHGAGRPAEVEP
jgi:CheY-like chemotaxis protein/nitrogen-specific signal transduction histidine kinase